MKKFLGLVIFITIIILALEIYATNTAPSKLNVTGDAGDKNGSQLMFKFDDNELHKLDNIKELFYLNHGSVKKGRNHCNGIYPIFDNYKKIRATENIQNKNDPCIDNIMKSDDGKSYFGSFQEIPACYFTDRKNQQLRQSNRHHKVTGGSHLHRNIQSSNEDDEYSYYEGSDVKSEKQIESGEDKEKGKEEHKISTQRSVAKHRKYKHKGIKQHRRSHSKINGGKCHQTTGSNQTERNLEKRNIVLTELDPSQRTVLEEEQEQQKDKAALEHARIAQDIVSSVISQSGANMRKTLGICQKSSPQNFIDLSTDLHEHQLVQEVLTSVEEALISAVSCKECLTLHADMLSFLNWLVSGSSSHSCCIPIDKVHHNKNYFLFDPHHHMYGEKCNQTIDSLNSGLLNEQAMMATTCAATEMPTMTFETATQSYAHSNEMPNKPLRKVAANRQGGSRKKVHDIVALDGTLQE